MKKIKDYDSTKAITGYSNPTNGGYVCIIKKVEDHADQEYLHIEFDIAEGEFKNYALDTQERAGFWPLDFNKSYKAKALGFFKAMIEAVEKTNNNFLWDWNEQKLVNKGVGIVLREEEYLARNGSIKVRLKPFAFKSANEIRSGEFTIPERKTLNAAAPVFTEEEDDGELPF